MSMGVPFTGTLHFVKSRPNIVPTPRVTGRVPPRSWPKYIYGRPYGNRIVSW